MSLPATLLLELLPFAVPLSPSRVNGPLLSRKSDVGTKNGPKTSFPPPSIARRNLPSQLRKYLMGKIGGPLHFLHSPSRGEIKKPSTQNSIDGEIPAGPLSLLQSRIGWVAMEMRRPG